MGATKPICSVKRASLSYSFMEEVSENFTVEVPHVDAPPPPPRSHQRKPHEPTQKTRRQVKRLVMAGSTKEKICGIIGIDPSQLEYHYAFELTWHDVTVGRVASVVLRKALKGNEACALFWLRARGGWRDRDTSGVNIATTGPVVAAPAIKQLESDLLSALSRIPPKPNLGRAPIPVSNQSLTD